MSSPSHKVGRGLLTIWLAATFLALCPCVPGAAADMDCCLPGGGLAISESCCPGTGTQTTVLASAVALVSLASPATLPGSTVASGLDHTRLLETPVARPATARRILRI